MRVCDEIERDEKVYLGECGGFFNGHTHRRQKTANVGSTLRTQRGLTTQRQPQINDTKVVVVDASRENSGLQRQRSNVIDVLHCTVAYVILRNFAWVFRESEEKNGLRHPSFPLQMSEAILYH